VIIISLISYWQMQCCLPLYIWILVTSRPVSSAVPTMTDNQPTRARYPEETNKNGFCRYSMRSKYVKTWEKQELHWWLLVFLFLIWLVAICSLTCEQWKYLLPYQ
jgi:hypothetical protein